MYNEGSLLVASIFFSGGVFALRFSRRIFGSYLAPPGIYAGVWLFSLSVFYIGVISYYALELRTLVVFLFSILTFTIGGLLSKKLIKRKNNNFGYFLNQSTNQNRRLRWAIYILFGLGVLGSTMYYLEFHRLIGIESLYSDPRLVRFEESMGELRRVRWIGLTRSLLVPSFILSVIYLCIKPMQHKKSMWVVVIVSLFSLAASSGRTLVMTLGLCSGLSVIYVAQNIGEPISFRKYGLPILTGSVLFFAYFVTTTSMLHKWVSYVYLTKVTSHLPDALIGLADLTHYLVGGFPAFQSLINSSEEANQSVSFTFGVISRIMHEIDPSLFGYPDYVQPFVFVPIPCNLYTYLDAFYRDFGWIGIAIFPFLIGLVTTTLYLWMRRSPGIMKVYVVSLMGLCIFQSTGVNTFGTFQTWVWIASPLGLVKLLALFSGGQRKYRFLHDQNFTKVIRTGPLFRNTENKS